ncbi:MAG: glycoside hydrolase family 9 protein [Prolixibacteraceae bacterium]|nr:glycoside hydrolase family 9 protein [Prolixibacteraceae bacterium]
MRSTFIFIFIMLVCTVNGQDYSRFIIVDQFGYPPSAKKIAILKNPLIGFDQDKSYSPGTTFAVVNATSHEKVFTGAPVSWKSGTTDQSSGDQVWHFDFSSLETTGQYYILDVENNLRSYTFQISPGIYNEILKHAVRTFFYQRVGFAKDEQFAGKAWADKASHVGTFQDKNCRLFNDKTNAAKERDVSGGWYDAGDYNKYTSWTSSYVIDMMLAYLERPKAWADDYNLPESGNGIPDLLDEAKWGMDHLLRLQFDDGSVISIVGEAHASPPSKATQASFYGPANTSATINAGAAMAIASTVYRGIGMDVYADTLLNAARKAWNWAEANPRVLFNNNDAAYGSQGLGAGQMETDDYGRLTSKLRLAAFLFEATGEEQFRAFFDANYRDVHMLQWNFAFPFESAQQNTLLYYAALDNATPSVEKQIKDVYRNAMLNGSENFPAYNSLKDPYRAHIKDYTWGSNSVKQLQGMMYWNLVDYQIEVSKNDEVYDAGLGYINSLHGVNPLNMVYLSNMYLYGADNGVNEFYHSWFTDGSALWDRVGESVYGPAPGFLTGGPNPSYDWDGCCPTGCGSVANNNKCNAENIAPPKGQPTQKSYKDFNTSWPLNSWSVTENSCGYQINYIRLLSKYVDLRYDCHGDENGSASIDICGRCVGGHTGLEAAADGENCPDENVGNPHLRDLLDIRIFPNPIANSLIIQLQEDHASVDLLDLNGRSLLKTCLERDNQFDVSFLSPGIYLLNIETDLGVYSQRLIKN